MSKKAKAKRTSAKHQPTALDQDDPVAKIVAEQKRRTALQQKGHPSMGLPDNGAPTLPNGEYRQQYDDDVQKFYNIPEHLMARPAKDDE